MTENNSNPSGNKSVSKWEKTGDDINKEEMRVKYLENEEKRKQLAMDNQRRRKETQKRRQQELELKKREEEEQLRSRKKLQQEASAKYLGRNTAQKGTNLYDKYQAQKKAKKELAPEVRSNKKWGGSLSNSRQKQGQSDNDNLNALDLDVQAAKDLDRIKRFYQQGREQLKSLQNLQKEWADPNQQLRQSSLLDSLDLDYDTVLKSKVISGQEEPLFESFEKMRESFKEDSGTKDDGKKQHSPVAVRQDPKVRSEDQQIKQLIGYDSLDQSADVWSTDLFRKKTDIQSTLGKKQVAEEDIQKDHKKIQLMGWAPKIEEVQQSGVSSNMSRQTKPRQHILQSMNQKIKSMKTKIQPKREDQASRAQQRRQSLELRKSIQKRYSLQRRKNINVTKSTEKPVGKKRSQADKLPPIKPNFKESRMTNITAPMPAKSIVSKDQNSRLTGPIRVKQDRSTDKLRNQPSKNTMSYFDNPQTTYSNDDNLDMAEFIKEDLCDLNQRQRQLQVEIKDIHFANRARVKSIQQKYQVQTGYRSTKQLINKQKQFNVKDHFTQDQLEQSLVRLDELLKKQDRKLDYLGSLPIQQQRKQSEDSLRMSDSLETDVNTTPINPNDYGELLSDIIKLAARNVGQDENNVDLDKLKQHLTKINQETQQYRLQSQYNQSYSTKHIENLPQEESQSARLQPKPDTKKQHGNKQSYLQMMRNKVSPSTGEAKTKFKLVLPNEPLPQTTVQQSQSKQQKISVNQKLRRLLLQ